MPPRRSFLTLGAGLAVAALSRRTHAQTNRISEGKETIAMLGTGKMASVLGKGWAAAGHTVIYGSRAPGDTRVTDLVRESGARASATTSKDAIARAGMVMFALPWEPVKDLLPTLGDLGGKIVMDPMIHIPPTLKEVDATGCNPVSVGEQLQSWLPGAHVVKAFNTIAAKTIVDPARTGRPISIALAGDDAAAKTRVAKLVSAFEGLEPLDCGPIRAARYIESLLLLSINYSVANKGKRIEFFFRAHVT
jgi:8-hydroxy-5-deazaflavin:NADPH oxidoreductase